MWSIWSHCLCSTKNCRENPLEIYVSHKLFGLVACKHAESWEKFEMLEIGRQDILEIYKFASKFQSQYSASVEGPIFWGMYLLNGLPHFFFQYNSSATLLQNVSGSSKDCRYSLSYSSLDEMCALFACSSFGAVYKAWWPWFSCPPMLKLSRAC